MPADFAAALSAIERMKREGIVIDYAIGGAMAFIFWTEPVATFDLDVFVFLPDESPLLVSLDPIYRWAEANSYPAEDAGPRDPAGASDRSLSRAQCSHGQATATGSGTA